MKQEIIKQIIAVDKTLVEATNRLNHARWELGLLISIVEKEFLTKDEGSRLRAEIRSEGIKVDDE